MDVHVGDAEVGCGRAVVVDLTCDRPAGLALLALIFPARALAKKSVSGMISRSADTSKNL